MAEDHILDLKEKVDTQLNLRRYEYHEYLPVSGTNLNAAGEIRIYE